MGSDIHSVRCNCYIWGFNSRSLRGERLHGDKLPFNFFQFTLPAWGAISSALPENGAIKVSIHAPRMGSDCIPHNLNRDVFFFNSRSPHGERSGFCIFSVTALFFQFSLPAWRATPRSTKTSPSLIFFNSRSPHGERPEKKNIMRSSKKCFQFSLPAWRATFVFFCYK